MAPERKARAQPRRPARLEGAQAPDDLSELMDVLFANQDVPRVVRDPIVESWQRCYSQDLDPCRLQVPHGLDVDVNGLLHDAAGPVIDGLEKQLADEPVSIILTDEHGHVVERRAGNRRLNENLDRVQLAPGASYSEEHVGTNGIGTAAANGLPFRVFGTEHYAEWLRGLSCAGAPIRHPVTGRMLGILDLTCFEDQGNAVLCALDREAAADIERRLLELTSASEQALFRAFRTACSHTRRRPILCMADDVLMTNQAATRTLSPQDLQTLLAVAQNLPRRGEDWKRAVDLSAGPAVVRVTPVSHGPRAAGVIVRVEHSGARHSMTQLPTTDPPNTLAGRSVAWRRAWSELRVCHGDRRWVLLTGEPGVGKSALVMAAHRQRMPRGRLRVVDVADAAPNGSGGAEAAITALADPATSADDTVLLRHLEGCEASMATRMAQLLGEHQPLVDRPWLAATLTLDGRPPPHLDPVLRLLGDPVAVPPLRHRVEDLHELVPVLLRRVAGGEYRVSRDAMQLLLHGRWPGNVDELERVLAAAANASWTREISAKDLPAECHATSPRVLTAMEAVERDTIVEALIQTRGNVTETADRLGLSRATVYRRIRTFGIDCDRYRTADR